VPLRAVYLHHLQMPVVEVVVVLVAYKLLALKKTFKHLLLVT
jgi:hypothetical protein